LVKKSKAGQKNIAAEASAKVQFFAQIRGFFVKSRF
jgi:hypothetical protein